MAVTQRDVGRFNQNGWSSHNGLVAMPVGLIPADVTILTIIVDGSSPPDPGWTSPGFEELDTTLVGPFAFTRLKGDGSTNVSGFDAFTVTPTTPPAGGDFVSMSVTSWIDADYDAVIAGTVISHPTGTGSVFNIPEVTTTEPDAVLIACGATKFSTMVYAPVMTEEVAADAHQATRDLAAAGATGDTLVTPNNLFQPWVWGHIGLQSPSAAIIVPGTPGVVIVEGVAGSPVLAGLVVAGTPGIVVVEGVPGIPSLAAAVVPGTPGVVVVEGVAGSVSAGAVVVPGTPGIVVVRGVAGSAHPAGVGPEVTGPATAEFVDPGNRSIRWAE